MIAMRVEAVGHGKGARAIRLPWAVSAMLVALTVTLTVTLTVALAPQAASAQAFQLFVPVVLTDGEGPGGTSEECGLNAEEAAIAANIVNDPGQQRDNPVCHPILAQVARDRARDMALRGYFSHTNPDGKGPNLLLREAGYPLPDWYGDERDANNIESIGGGYTSPDLMWQGWMDSEKHRTHILATHSFYADQVAYGVGYYADPNSPLKHYWVFLSAPLE